MGGDLDVAEVVQDEPGVRASAAVDLEREEVGRLGGVLLDALEVVDRHRVEGPGPVLAHVAPVELEALEHDGEGVPGQRGAERLVHLRHVHGLQGVVQLTPGAVAVELQHGLLDDADRLVEVVEELPVEAGHEVGVLLIGRLAEVGHGLHDARGDRAVPAERLAEVLPRGGDAGGVDVVEHQRRPGLVGGGGGGGRRSGRVHVELVSMPDSMSGEVKLSFDLSKVNRLRIQNKNKTFCIF